MGVRSLTTYLEYRSKQYFENYRLHDCNLVIDGSCLCYNLYNWNHSFWNTGYSYDCYGGDYDKYAEIVKSFFQMLKVCNVEPLMVFGGRNGSGRLSRIKKRLNYKMKVANQKTPDNERNIKTKKFDMSQLESVSAGLKYVFKDILNELGLKMFTCDEDPIREMSSLAKQLKCPILSMNSDFFVLSSMFIPFSSLTCQLKVVNNPNWKDADRKSYQFIQCKLYRIGNLLYVLNKPYNNDFMPYLLPVLLGSEYIDDKIFKPFFNALKIKGPGQYKVNRIFEWIRGQDSLDDALKKILDSFHTIEKRNSVSEKINHVIMTYSPVSIQPLLNHFNIGSVKNATTDFGKTADNEKANLTVPYPVINCAIPVNKPKKNSDKMGVKSLTTYLECRSRQYFENYRLHDCNLIIDGSNLCFNLYNWEYSFWNTGYSYDCYGGDYDKYAEIVRNFFHMLKVCNVEPFIVFGGRNGSDRVSSIIKKRLDDKLKNASEITPDETRNMIKMQNIQKSNFPSHVQGSSGLKYVFRDILYELGLKMFTCTEDPNREIACLAKQLKCPVLSTNSDFFVLGSMLIPFSSVSCQVNVNTNPNRRDSTDNNKSYQFIQCQLYKIENLLYVLNKRPNKDFMPYLLPVLLGSEYINKEILEPFFNSSLRLRGPRQKVIDGIFDWIRRQDSLDGALKKILDSFYGKEERNSASEQINHTIMSYSPVSIQPLLEHFNIGSVSTNQNQENFDSGDTSADIEKADLTGLELFTKRFGGCRYPSFFMDMLKEDRYLLLPNIDDCTRPDSNSIGLTIMSSIHNILVQNEQKKLTVLKRDHHTEMKEYVLPAVTDQLPSIKEIDYLHLESRLKILLKVLEIDQNFCQIFEGFSTEWHLFLLSLKYTKSKSELDSSFIYSLVLCFIILNYVDSNLKYFYRTTADIRNIKINQNIDSTPVEQNEFPKISANDSVSFMQQCIKYFELNSEDNAKTFDRGIMHSLSEFECIFLHLKYLNNLLDFPVKDALIHKIFDNTFIYNMTKNLKSVSGLKNYLNDFLQECSTIQSAFFYIIELLEKHAIL